jgi:hypothetical protein
MAGSKNQGINMKWEKKKILKTDNVSSISFSPNGKTIVSGSSSNTISLWNVDTSENVKTLTGHKGDVLSVCFSPDGKTVVSGSYDKTVRLWNVDTGVNVKTLTGHEGPINSVSFSPNGKTVVSGSDDETVRLWNVDTGVNVKILMRHEGPVNSVSFSPDGKTVVSGSYDETVRLWNVDTGVNVKTLDEHEGPVNSVSFSPDGKMVVSCDSDGMANFWYLENDKTNYISTFGLGYQSDMRSVSFSPDGKMVAFMDDQKHVQFFLTNGIHIQTLKVKGPYISSFSRDWKTIANANGNSIEIWEQRKNDKVEKPETKKETKKNDKVEKTETNKETKKNDKVEKTETNKETKKETKKNDKVEKPETKKNDKVEKPETKKQRQTKKETKKNDKVEKPETKKQRQTKKQVNVPSIKKVNSTEYLGYKQIQKDLNSNGTLDHSTFQRNFSVLENKGDGDCLFFSVCQQDDTYKDAKTLRKEVCDFYKNFTFEDNLYVEDTLQKKLCFAYITDNTEYHARTGKPNKVTHVNRICKPKQYAGIMDIIAISIILQRPTILFNDIGEDVQQYIVEEYSDFTISDNRPLYIRYDGAEHFEAVIPLLHEGGKRKSRRSRKSKQSKKSKQSRKNRRKSHVSFRYIERNGFNQM